MPYIAAWDEFARAAEKLYLSDPLKCRCVTKYRHADGKLVMKVTKPLLLCTVGGIEGTISKV